MKALEKVIIGYTRYISTLAVESKLPEQAAAELVSMQARIEKLETENSVMYAALLEASELGNSAALRCKVELQRIARNEAKE